MDLSIGGCRADLVADHGQHVGDPSHSDPHLQVRLHHRLHHLVHPAQIVKLSLNAPQLTEPSDVVLLQLRLQEVYFVEGLLDLLVVGVAGDGVGEEETIEEAVRFDQTIEIHELPTQALVAAVTGYLVIGRGVPIAAACSSICIARANKNIYY